MYVGRILVSEPIAMADFDPMNVVKVAKRHLASISDPRRRLILENFIEHATAEAQGDYEALMASCSREKQEYASYGSEFAAPQSYAELEIHYRGLIDANMHLVHFAVEKLVVGSDVILVEGIVHQLYPGHMIRPLFGISVESESDVYQLTKRTSLTFVFDEAGKGAGEQAYADGPTTLADLVKVEPGDVPDAFKG